MILITNQDSSFKITRACGEIEEVKRFIKPGDIVTYYEDFQPPWSIHYDVKDFYVFRVESISIKDQRIIPVQDSVYSWRRSGDKLHRTSFIGGYTCLTWEHLISRSTVLRKANTSELLHYFYELWLDVKKRRI